jgi:hypothetical protein
MEVVEDMEDMRRLRVLQRGITHLLRLLDSEGMLHHHISLALYQPGT